MGRGEGQAGKLAVLDRDTQQLGQLVDKAAGARRAGLVHLVVDDHAVALQHELRVLAADLDDVGVRVDLGGRAGLGRDLVLDQVGADEAAHQVAPRARDPHALDGDLTRAAGQQALEEFLDGIDGPACRHQVVLDQHAALLVDDSGLGAGRSHVYAQVTCPDIVLGRDPLAVRRSVAGYPLSVGRGGIVRGQRWQRQEGVTGLFPGQPGHPRRVVARQQGCAQGLDVQIALADLDMQRVPVAGGKYLVQCPDERPVGRQATGQEDGFCEWPTGQRGHHAGNALAQGVEHRADRHALLLQVDQV